MKHVGKAYKLDVYSSEWVDKDTIYLMNPKNYLIASRLEGFQKTTWLDHVRLYFKGIWKALRYK